MQSHSLQGLRAFIYDRNSRLLRPGTSTSTEDQRLENRRFCESAGAVVVGEFSDPGRSASRYAKQSREDYLAMVKGIESGACDVLVIWEASRAYRSTRAYLDLRDLCEKKGVLICYNGRVYNMRDRQDRFTTGFDALRAEDEAEQIRERVLRTTRLNAERGRPHGRIPYGYRREYDQETGALLQQVICEAEAAVIREAADRVLAGQSLWRIARDFDARGIPAPGGDGYEWTMLSVRGILMRPSNAGKRQHQGVVVGTATWDAILDEEVYYTITGILGDPARRTQRDSTVKHLLSGIPFCGPCMDEGTERFLKPANNGPARSYTCVKCFRVAVRTALLEEYVQHTVLAYVERPEFAAALRRQRADGAMASALAELQALEAQLEDARRLAATYDRGRFLLSPTSLAALEQQLLPRIEAARARAQEPTVHPAVRRLAAAGVSAGAVWGEMDLIEKRAALRGLVRIRINRTQQGARGIRPGRVGFDWLY